MKIVHHPDSATLVSYAAGNLDEGFATLVAAHVAQCGICRAALRKIESVGGALLDTVDDAPLSSSVLERTLSQLDQTSTDEIRVPSPNVKKIRDVPAPLARLLDGGLDDIAWKTVAPGVAKYPLPVSRAARSRLTMLKIAPGTKVPDHGHGGMELTLVLKGSYRDTFGRFGPGDLADLDEHVEHQPVVDSTEPCICVVATEAPTRFTNVFGRLLQPIVGI
jgi:putative transcriptional regulator